VTTPRDKPVASFDFEERLLDFEDQEMIVVRVHGFQKFLLVEGEGGPVSEHLMFGIVLL
jgi:hypothetical protein